MEEQNTVKHVGLKVTGLVLGIIAAITLVAVLFSVTALPGIRYSSAVKLAEEGHYKDAALRLRGLDYKDSAEKRDEYASITVKGYVDAGEIDKAVAFLQRTYVLKTDEDVQHANDILDQAQ